MHSFSDELYYGVQSTSLKPKKWANETNKVLDDAPLSSISKVHIAIGEAYGVIFISECMKKNK